MKKTILYIIISILYVPLGCEEFLDVEPDLQISIDEQLATKSGVLEAYTGIYSDIEELFSSRFAVYADVQGGNITFTPSATNKLVTIPSVIDNSYSFNDRYESSNYSELYSDIYEIINQTNLILERFSSFDFFSENESNRLRAELLIIRGFMHYELSIHYAQNYNFTSDASHLGIVYNTKTLIAGEDFPSRESIDQTYLLIQTDFDKGLELMNDEQIASGPVYSYFNKVNTCALYARIALQMNDWEKARDLANEVINTSGLSLMNTNLYLDEWEKDTAPVSEVLLEFSAPKTTNGTVSSSISEHFNYVSTSNYTLYVASGDLLSLYNSSDIRSNMFVEAELTTSVNGAEIQVPYYFTKKFQGNAGTICIRLSEIYLIRSEAYARLNNISLSLNDLNSIRNRANLDSISSLGTNFEEIFMERRRELAFERHLLFDIIRFKRDVNRNEGCISSLCNVSYPSNFFILPIPASSVDLNQNIQQNEGY